MNDLQRFFEKHTGGRIMKWQHYFEVYDRYCSRYRGTDVHFMEIGVYHGGSLAMWKDYFGPKAKIFGVDIMPDCAQFADEQVEVIIGDQADRAFLRKLTQQVPRIDVLLDDGGHTMEQQINTFEVMYPHVAADGIYICEDLSTSYSKRYGGGYRNPGSFIEYSKSFIDVINGWHSQEVEKLGREELMRSTWGLHFYTSMLVVEKRPIEPPEALEVGEPVIQEIPPHPLRPKPLHRRLLRAIWPKRG